jgi:hypothetical protein
VAKPIKITKPVLSETTIQPIPVTEIEKPTTNTNCIEPALIIKSGATDLRRGATKLFNDNITKIGNPKNGDVWAYANKPKTTVKLVMKKPDNTCMVTVHYKQPVDWPEYQPSDKPGHTVTLQGNEKEKFLKDIGCPKDL